MTSSGKVRIYELSRDLGLENKDVLEAADKLSIAVKSHSSSISDDEAAAIRGLIKGNGKPAAQGPVTPSEPPKAILSLKKAPTSDSPAAPPAAAPAAGRAGGATGAEAWLSGGLGGAEGLGGATGAFRGATGALAAAGAAAWGAAGLSLVEAFFNERMALGGSLGLTGP